MSKEKRRYKCYCSQPKPSGDSDCHLDVLLVDIKLSTKHITVPAMEMDRLKSVKQEMEHEALVE